MHLFILQHLSPTVQLQTKSFIIILGSHTVNLFTIISSQNASIIDEEVSVLGTEIWQNFYHENYFQGKMASITNFQTTKI